MENLWREYGLNPQGMLVFTSDGKYTIQIFCAHRRKFGSGDGARGTPEDYKDASLGMSCHFGHYSVDEAKDTITFEIERTSFPNWDGTIQIGPMASEERNSVGDCRQGVWRRLR